jgi:hypothetical protein
MSTLSADAVEVLAVGDDAVAWAAALVSARLATIAITKIKAVSLLRIGLSFFSKALARSKRGRAISAGRGHFSCTSKTAPSLKKREKDGAPEHYA